MFLKLSAARALVAAGDGVSACFALLWHSKLAMSHFTSMRRDAFHGCFHAARRRRAGKCERRRSATLQRIHVAARHQHTAKNMQKQAEADDSSCNLKSHHW